jgi:hypothetical protein
MEQSIFESLCDKAVELGAIEAKLIATESCSIPGRF